MEIDLKTSQYFISGIAQACAEGITIRQLSNIVSIIHTLNIPEDKIGIVFDRCIQAQVGLNEIAEKRKQQ